MLVETPTWPASTDELEALIQGARRRRRRRRIRAAIGLLAFMALEAKDTTAALSEMELAVQLRGDDAAAHYLYGFTLASTGKATKAEAEVRKAIALNAVYAAPHFVLGAILEFTGRKADALAEYQTFVARATQIKALWRTDWQRIPADCAM